MLEIYEKKTIYRLVGPNQRIKMKASAFEVVQNPVGVDAVNVLEAQTTMIRFLTNKILAVDELLLKILNAPEATFGTKE